MDNHGTALPLDAADREFRDELRAWLDENLVGDFVGQSDRGGPDDDDNWELRRAWEQKLGEGNWLGLSWPKRYGGREATLTQEILFAMEYAAAGAPPRAGFHGETLMAPTALHYGTEEQKARLLPPMARGEVVWCQGYSEPGAGSDLANISTKARLEDGEWVVNGQKIWTTFAHHADWMFAIVRTEPGSTRHAGLSYMLIPLDQPGVQVVPIRTMLGDSGFNEVFFDDARTSADNVLGAPGEGWKAAMTTLGHERATSVLNYQFSFRREMATLQELARRKGATAGPGPPGPPGRLAHRAGDHGLQQPAHPRVGPPERRVRTGGVDGQVLLVEVARASSPSSRWTCWPTTAGSAPSGDRARTGQPSRCAVPSCGPGPRRSTRGRARSRRTSSASASSGFPASRPPERR